VFHSRFTPIDARQRLGFALSMARALVRRRVVDKMVAEPFLRYLWGKNLPELLSHYWRIAAKTSGGWDRVGGFPSDVQEQTGALWFGHGKEWGIGDIFPALTTVHSVKPGRFARVKWPEILGGSTWDRRVFVSSEETAKRAAAVLLFWSLRTGV